MSALQKVLVNNSLKYIGNIYWEMTCWSPNNKLFEVILPLKARMAEGCNLSKKVYRRYKRLEGCISHEGCTSQAKKPKLVLIKRTNSVTIRRTKRVSIKRLKSILIWRLKSIPIKRTKSAPIRRPKLVLIRRKKLVSIKKSK